MRIIVIRGSSPPTFVIAATHCIDAPTLQKNAHKICHFFITNKPPQHNNLSVNRLMNYATYLLYFILSVRVGVSYLSYYYHLSCLPNLGPQE